MSHPNKASRLLVISDIHGHTDGLLLLLEKARYCPNADRLILLGDYIDSNPSTLSTLWTVQKLVAEGARAVPGNQETSLIKGLDQFHHSGTGMKGAHGIEDSIIQWLKDLPPYIVEDDYLFVHAGMRPDVPLHRQTLTDMTEIREEFWNVPDPCCEQTVIFGHTPTFKLGAPRGELWFGERKIGIDTGAKHECRLTLFDVHAGITYSCSTASHDRYRDFRIKENGVRNDSKAT
ncbi:metallophosphoesterase family protein [Marinicrinis lubricantis]|uniref:Metallophosphoesterase family protein n=1 Tax=Marinicrinis lubricantis TaxID=2086470 RepID=A0ABW1ISX9_9BACL